MMKLYKRILSILCVAGMIVSSFPFTAMATGDDGAVQPAASGQTVEVSGSIVWKNQDEQSLPSSVSVTLYANGEATETKQTVTAETDWAFTFSGLAEEDESGKIVYTVVQAAVEDYTTSYSQDTLTITNTYTGETAVQTERKAEDRATSYSQDALTITDTYTDETAVRTEQKVDISGTVHWVNRDKQYYYYRPSSVTLTLYANGVATENKLTVNAASGNAWAYSFKDMPETDANGNAIVYTVVQDAVPNYETTYSADTLTITNSYIGGVPTNHTFGHIDVRINGAKLEVQYLVYDANGKVISRTSKKITAYVTKVESVTINGITYNSGFTKSGNYEFRKMRGVSISSRSLTASSTATLVVDLQDANGKTYDNVSITYGLGGIMDAAYGCDGYGGGRFDGLDFTVGDAMNYSIDIRSYGLQVPIQKYVQVGSQQAQAFSGQGGEFAFLMTEYNQNNTKTGRTWRVTNDANGAAVITLDYPYDDINGFNNYLNKTYTYKLSEEQGTGQYQYDTTEYTFTVGFDYNETDTGKTLKPEIKQAEYANATFAFTNKMETVNVAGRKTWNDNGDQDGVRPDSIIINLMKNGQVLQSKTVTAEDDWAWNFENLPKYENGNEINYTITEDAVENYTTVYRGYDVENQYTPKKTSLTVTKSWDDKGNQDGIRPNSITVKLFSNGQDTGKTLTLNSANQWRGDFTDLDEFSAGEKIAYTVAEVSVPGYISVITGTPAEGYVITNTHTPAVTEVAGRKTWKDNNDQDGVRPDSITINLMKNGQLFQSKTVTANNGWAWSFENLPKYENGNEITYSIIETVVEGYTTEYNNYDVTNSYTPKKTSISVSKSWEDANNQDGIRPNDVIVKLFADGEDTGKTLTLSQGNQWTGSFTDLDQFNGGQQIRYTVEETAVEGYTSAITGDMGEGYVITNTHVPAVTEVEGRKTWKDNNDQDGARPDSITINLMKNGQVFQSETVTANNGWAWSFENLPKYENGNEITYSITENAVEGYTTEYDGTNVINSYTPQKTSVTVTKSWEDSDNQDGIRPDNVTVKLFANGEDTGKTLTLNARNQWTGSFTELDQYANGEEIRYTVQEAAVDGYEADVAGSQKEGFVLINTHIPEMTKVEGRKIWNDNGNAFNARPDSINIMLMKNGKLYESMVVTANDDWTWSLGNLPKYENGEEIIYSVVETAVDGYTTEYDGYDVSNTYNAEKTSITVVKAWVDNNNAENMRPGKVTIKLFADGKDTGKTLILDAGNRWTGSFTDLDKYVDGKLVAYTVQEEAVDGYNTVITGSMEKGFTVTNSHTSVPKTGDTATSLPWLALMMISGLAVVFIGVVAKKQKRTAR